MISTVPPAPHQWSCLPGEQPACRRPPVETHPRRCARVRPKRHTRLRQHPVQGARRSQACEPPGSRAQSRTRTAWPGAGGLEAGGRGRRTSRPLRVAPHLCSAAAAGGLRRRHRSLKLVRWSLRASQPRSRHLRQTSTAPRSAPRGGCGENLCGSCPPQPLISQLHEAGPSKSTPKLPPRDPFGRGQRPHA